MNITINNANLQYAPLVNDLAGVTWANGYWGRYPNNTATFTESDQYFAPQTLVNTGSHTKIAVSWPRSEAGKKIRVTFYASDMMCLSTEEYEDTSFEVDIPSGASLVGIQGLKSILANGFEDTANIIGVFS